MRRRLFWLAGLLVAAPLTGCSPSQVYGCTAVSLSVRDTPVAAITDDLPLAATLTADGRPVPGQPLNFWLYDTGAGQPAGAGVYVGTKSTGPDGVARLTLAGGPAAQLLAGAVPTGFGAQKPQRKDYCGASAKARLRCGTAPSAACPPVRMPTG
ncbi:hypothetical protein [Actinacidiphila bryophytorum]|uniref:hypothetical protein n=1 Tax=Actinacidiphila bryophytorum TaxID=1436133 RepID=UPI002176EE22|nr:hypothetical protein [Actinacidiphila bryophytorum]UWE11071.1 hypothetical protein NYE86_21710 [Actinacidiphila bryophytorum]